jgi:plastocyanin
MTKAAEPRSPRLTSGRRPVVAALALLLLAGYPEISASAASSFHDRGTLQSTQSAANSITVYDTGGDPSLRGRAVTIYLTPSTNVQRDGKKATLVDLGGGDGINASGHHDKRGRLVASSVDATSPPRPDGPAVSAPGSCPYYLPCTPTLPPSTGGPKLTITISNYTFNPPVSVIPVGTLVTDNNTDSAAHTFSGNHLDSGTLGTGRGYTVEFTTPGTYRFFCAIHPFMTGAVDVR